MSHSFGCFSSLPLIYLLIKALSAFTDSSFKRTLLCILRTFFEDETCLSRKILM